MINVSLFGTKKIVTNPVLDRSLQAIQNAFSAAQEQINEADRIILEAKRTTDKKISTAEELRSAAFNKLALELNAIAANIKTEGQVHKELANAHK